MDRRQFVAVVGGAALTASVRSAEEQAKEPGKTVSPASGSATENAGARQNTWLPLDWWHVEHQDNVELRQGRPEWVPEATYEDPTFDYLGFWPCVWQDAASGQWRMLYFATGIPLTLMGAESDDGVHWHPMNRPDMNLTRLRRGPNLRRNTSVLQCQRHVPMSAQGAAT